jgi:Arginase family
MVNAPWLAFLAGTYTLIYYPSCAMTVREAYTTPWQKTYGNTHFDSPFSGPLSFAHLPHEDCLTTYTPFDIAIVGFPFDTSVTYRPGARFGPQGIRVGSRRIRRSSGWDPSWGINPYDGAVTVIDCGDVSYEFSELVSLSLIVT